jgi:hypothetical protein
VLPALDGGRRLPDSGVTDLEGHILNEELRTLLVEAVNRSPRSASVAGVHGQDLVLAAAADEGDQAATVQRDPAVHLIGHAR